MPVLVDDRYRVNRDMESSGQMSGANVVMRRAKNQLQFMWAALRSPSTIGSVIPSSRSLARAMAAGVDMARGSVLELGAGTGSVTQALVEVGVPVDQLFILERDPRLHRLMQRHYPQLLIMCADAVYLRNVLDEYGVPEIGTIVSSLPFLSMPPLIRERIQEQMVAVLGDAGVIIQFTYGLQSPISEVMMKRLGLIGVRKRMVMANVPPAHVWHYRRV